MVRKTGHIGKCIRNNWEVRNVVLEKFLWTDRVTNEEVLHRVKQKRFTVIQQKE